MLEKDYIMRLIRQFFEALELLIRRKKDHPLPIIRQEISNLYLTYLNRPAEFFYENEPEALLQYLHENYPTSQFLHRLEIISELMYADANVKTSEAEKNILLEKVLPLIEYLDTHSDTFSLERRRKIAEIKGLITQ